MAEGNDNLEELITCGICDEILTEPKTLPKCLHTFCLVCIKRWSQSCQSERKPVTCPSCREVIGAPGGDVANLPTSFHHKSLIQVYNSFALKKKSQELQNLRKEIATKNDNFNEVLDWCMTAVEQTDEKIKKTDEEIALAKNEVHRNTLVQIEILQKHEKAKLDYLDAICTRRKAEHEEVKNKISHHIQEILELNNKSQKCETMNTEHMKTEEFKQFLDACKATIERTKSTLSIYQVPCNPTILYIPNPEVIEILENLQVGEIKESVPDPSRCTIECVQPTRCGFINQFSIITRDSKGDQCYTKKDLIDVNIQDTDGNTVPKEITQSENAGQFSVKYKVEKPSPYNVLVSVAGKPIQNSPQRIKAIDAKAEFKPVRFFQTTRASSPITLAMNGRGDIAVVNNKGGNECRIVLYSADGEYVREFGGEGTGESRLRDPLGVVFTNDNHILVSDNFTHGDASIKEYHIDGRLLRTVYKQKGMSFRRMCTSGQNIACLSYNKQSKETSIMLFSRETGDHLQDVKLHAPDVKTLPRYLAYDKNKYFVTFADVYNLYVFDNNGGLFYTIGEEGNNEGQLKHPFGLAVFGSNDMLLVCDGSNHRVQLFHQNGDFIRSFGTRGSGLGQIDGPCDVAVTPDGQVLVLEWFGKRIQMFQ